MSKLAGIILLGLALGAGAGPVLVYTNGVLPVEGSMWVENVPRPSPAVTNLLPVITWTNDNGTVLSATNMSYDIGMGSTYTTSIVHYAVIDFNEFVTDAVTNVPPKWVAKLVKRWASQGKICEVLGRHCWEESLVTKPYRNAVPEDYANDRVRQCTICGKKQRFKPGEWE